MRRQWLRRAPLWVAARFLSSAVTAALLLLPARAEAQSTTFYLDRLQIAGAPEDGVAVWRPRIGATRFYGQLALGYALNPLRADNLVNAREQAKALSGPPVATQLTTYFTAGVELAERGALQVSLPITVFQSGSPTDNPSAGIDQAVSLAKAAPADVRVDGRVLLARSESGLFSLGARAALFLPTGNERSFTGDPGAWGNAALAAELDFKKVLVVLNAGTSIRPRTTLNELTVGSELTYGVAAYLPLLRERLRLGAEIFGSVGLLPATAGDLDTTPLEWSLSGRLFFQDKHTSWLGLAAGTRLTDGYAPDFRAVALVGGVLSFDSQEPVVIAPALNLPVLGEADTDKDGVPDALDLCPVQADDGVHPDDGCPEKEKEKDADGDGFADSLDKCPREPGVHSADPANEGCPQFIRRIQGEVQFKEKIAFDFSSGKSTLLASSYPSLDEMAKLLRANPDIKQLTIAGHTDNLGDEASNLELSRLRAAAVFNYLVNRGGIAKGRLKFEGFGSTRPLAPNDTEAGRAKNRRVDFLIDSDSAPAPTPAPAP